MINGLSLFSNVGIGELNLKKCGINIVIANEIEKDRAEFYKSVYPECNVINEDINKDVYDSFKTKGSRLETSSVSSEPVKALYELTLKTFYSSRDILEASIDLLAPLMDSTQNQKHGNSGSDLTATLSAYIRCGFNVSKAAKKLNIHRQSMIYRLHRIEDLTGLSLSDPDNIYLLWTALRVLNLN